MERRHAAQWKKSRQTGRYGGDTWGTSLEPGGRVVGRATDQDAERLDRLSRVDADRVGQWPGQGLWGRGGRGHGKRGETWRWIELLGPSVRPFRPPSVAVKRDSIGYLQGIFLPPLWFLKIAA